MVGWIKKYEKNRKKKNRWMVGWIKKYEKKYGWLDG